jgi:hypothetical protein
MTDIRYEELIFVGFTKAHLRLGFSCTYCSPIFAVENLKYRER